MRATAKRSGIVRSSSQGEIGMLTFTNPIESNFSLWEKKLTAIKNPKIARRTEYLPRNRVPTFELQILEPSDDKPRQESEFLRACFLCKKKFNENEDIFMYGNDQIVLDGFLITEDSNESFLTKYGPKTGLDTRGIHLP